MGIKIEGPTNVAPSALAGEVAGPKAATGVASAEAAAGIQGADALRALASELAAGHITSRQALEQLVDRAIEQVQFKASPETVQRMRAALIEFAARDPYLSDKL